MFLCQVIPLITLYRQYINTNCPNLKPYQHRQIKTKLDETKLDLDSLKFLVDIVCSLNTVHTWTNN